MSIGLFANGHRPPPQQEYYCERIEYEPVKKWNRSISCKNPSVAAARSE